MKRLLTLGALFGGLLFPTVSGSEDVFSVAAHSYGAAKFTADIYGHNGLVENAEESIWDGEDAISAGTGPVRCFSNMNTGTVPTAAAIFISSDDEADAGEEITVDALDVNWNPVTIVQALGVAAASGTVNAQIGTADLMRINRAYVAGRTAVVGNIYLHLDDTIGTDGLPDTILTDLVAHITIGNNETQMACYSVPNDYTAFVTHICTDNDTITGSGTVDFRLRASVDGQISRVRWGPHVVADAAGDCRNFTQPLSFGEMTDIDITGLSTGDSASANIGLVLVKNGRSLTGP
jgi:hypothetical protein